MINDRSINENDYTIHVEGIEDVKQSWRRILRTVPGAVRMNPTFGCDLYKYIDLPVTNSFSKAASDIIAAISKWETRATINKITRTVIESRVYINIVGVYVSTGESIITQLDLSTIFTAQKNKGIGYQIIESTNTIE